MIPRPRAQISFHCPNRDSKIRGASCQQLCALSARSKALRSPLDLYHLASQSCDSLPFVSNPASFKKAPIIFLETSYFSILMLAGVSDCTEASLFLMSFLLLSGGVASVALEYEGFCVPIVSFVLHFFRVISSFNYYFELKIYKIYCIF